MSALDSTSSAMRSVTLPSLGSRLSRTFAAMAVGLLVTVLTVALAGAPAKEIIKVVGVAVLLLAAIASGRAKQVLLFSWVLCLTYNRNYFIDALGDHGHYGLYWTPSDVFFLALLAIWGYESAFRRVPKRSVGPPAWPYFLPFASACFLSALTAIRPDWAMFEMVRVLRIGLILWYVRYNVRGAEWWICLAGFASAIVVQSILGVFYVATGRVLGLAYFFGASGEAEGFRHFIEAATPSAWRRGEGTLGHPNTLALYLLLVNPLFIALSLTTSNPRLRWASGLIGLTGLVGLVFTLSRTGWALTFLQCVALALGLSAMRVAPLKRVLGVASIAALAGMLAVIPFAERIERRLTSDLEDSLDFRARHDRIALEIWQTNPYLGVGLNNYSDVLAGYNLEEIEVFLDVAQYARDIIQMRVTAWVHNIYLLMLGETGIVGLGAFFIFIGGAMVVTVRSILITRGVSRALSFAILVSMMGVHLHGLQESALWIDPVTYSFALVVGLASVLPAVARRAFPERSS